MKVSSLIANDKNPRTISKEAAVKLSRSINDFPEMMELRPIIVDDDMVVLGGNRRLEAIILLGMDEIPDSWVKKAEDLTEEQKKEFIIKDNTSAGEWEYELLSEYFDTDLLGEWGLIIPSMKETAKLSSLEYEPLYYEPTEIPSITLADCVDLTKYQAKLDVLSEYDLTDEQLETLKLFAYRFIKIDFERVANYYAFNAGEEEKKAIERLRLVLTDNGVNGFIEDDLLRILEIVNDD